MTTVSTYEARQNFSKLIELAFYRNEHFRVKRNNKPIAWIVGEPFMQRLGRYVEYLIENEPILADTLAIALDDDIRDAIEQGSEEVKDAQFIPLDDVVTD
ncbi:MAG: type II toxin-antitoxin system Phd/YefM family antitoxin [Taibaiella sp.]|nr:type II toxin-antitoxin system Phd/YefM family antitoxin [Taibaiella sp.]